MSREIIAIVGPTASGKSSLAVGIAKKIGGEIISADSRQIYRGLDIGTGKITKKEMRAIPHHLLDIRNPREQYSAGEFKQDAEKKIEEIARRGNIPIVVGGTGFWIDSLLLGLRLPDVPPDPRLRARLSRKNASELFRMLLKLDSVRARTIDPENPHRLVRAIEIARTLGRVPPIKKTPRYRVLWIGINLPMHALKMNIGKRAMRMVARGLIAETKSLAAKRVSKKRLRTLGFEYALSLNLLEGRLEKEKIVSALAARDSRYAKKQLAWFKKNLNIHWIKTKNEAFRLVRKSFVKYAAARTSTELGRSPAALDTER